MGPGATDSPNNIFHLEYVEAIRIYFALEAVITFLELLWSFLGRQWL